MRLRRSSPDRLVRFAAFSGVMAVLFVIRMVSSAKEPPLIRIQDITPLKNFSTVCIEGVLERDARMLKSGSVYYLINDGSGTLAAFDRFAVSNSLPRAGSTVWVEGSLSVGAGNNRRLNANRVQVVEASRHPRPAGGLAGIDRNHAGQTVHVKGRVCRAWVPREGSRAPYKIILKDTHGELDVVHWLSDAPRVGEGDLVEVSGVVCVYQGELQVKVLRTSDMRLH
jgi:hypothetical protein